MQDAQQASQINDLVFSGEIIPVLAVVLALSGMALPAAALSMGRKWAESQPEIAGTILGGVVAVCIVSILVGAVIILALSGWLPPLDRII